MSAAALELNREADRSPVSQAVMAVAAELAAPAGALEHAFTGLGDKLVECVGLLRALMGCHAAMPGELRGEAFVTAHGEIAGMRERAGLAAGEYLSLDARLGEFFELAKDIDSPLSDMRSSVRTFRLIATNARIVAAGLTQADGEIASFIGDMEELGRRAGEVVADLVATYSHFRSSLVAARHANAEFARDHGTTLERLSTDLERHLSALGRFEARADESASAHQKMAQQVNGRIANVIASLQIADSTRQRIEHVEQALRMAAELAADSPERYEASSAAFYALQTAQAEAAIVAFEKELDAIVFNLRELTQDSEDLLRGSGRDAEALLSDGSNALQALTGDIGSTCAMFAMYEDVHARLEVHLVDVAGSVRAMAGSLETIAELERNIHLVSLNTAIQCHRLGDEGAGLQVVSRNLRELAIQTVTAGNSIRGSLHRAGSLAEAIGRGSRSAATASTSAKGEDVATTFARAGVNLRQHFRKLSEIGPGATRLLHECARLAEDRRMLGSSLRQSSRTLETLRQESSAGEADPDAAFFAALRGRYSMDAERHLHDLIIGAPACDHAHSGHAVPEVADAIEDCLF